MLNHLREFLISVYYKKYYKKKIFYLQYFFYNRLVRITVTGINKEKEKFIN